MTMVSTYPIHLDLASRPCVVIGGKPFMVRRVLALLRARAQVTVISPDPCTELTTMAQRDEIQLNQRNYQMGDLRGVFLALNADRKRAEEIRQEATQQGTLLNTTDPGDSDFMLPAVLQHGALNIAVSTSGVFPAFAVRVRDELASIYGPEHALFLEWLALARAEIMQRVPDYAQRKRLWYAIIDSDVLDLLKQGDNATAWCHLRAILDHCSPESSS